MSYTDPELERMMADVESDIAERKERFSPHISRTGEDWGRSLRD